MKIKQKRPPRVFRVGKDMQIKMRDCGTIFLKADEQVTFVTDTGKKYDFAAKSWGFYATPSLNKRLKDEGFRATLVKNRQGRYYVMIVEKEKIQGFKKYLKAEKNQVVKWLDEL